MQNAIVEYYLEQLLGEVREYLLLRETPHYVHVQDSHNTIAVGDIVLVYDENLL